jgi:uncharacterized membrane protein
MKPPKKTNNNIPKQVPPQTNKNSHMMAAFQQNVVVTSLFDPNLVKKYSEMVPDAPERMLKIFEKNNEIEREVKQYQYKAKLYDHQENRRRDWMGYSLALIAFFAFIFFVWLGKTGPAIGSFFAFASMVIASFIKPKKK